MAKPRTKMLKLEQLQGGPVRVALYVRVSTDAQREEGYSVEIQTERLLAYASSLFGSSACTELYIDDGYSGGSLDRPQMQRLISDAENNRLTHVIVYKLDRLSRSQKDTLYLIEDVFLLHNVAFVSMQESFNTATAFGRAVIGILSVFAQLERENIFERTRGGMQKRVESGLWPGGGRVPFGYDYDREQGILIPNQDADKVRRLYQLYLQGWSLQRIADRLGLKYEKLAEQVLTRKSNAGFIVYNGVEYQGRHEPLISLETYEKAMSMLAERSARRLVVSGGHLLTGLLYCGCCGARMRYCKWSGGVWKLACYSQVRSKDYLVKDPDCQNAKVDAVPVEQAVIRDLFAMTRQDFRPETAELRYYDEQEALEKERSNEAHKLKRLYQRYATGEDEILAEAIAEQKQALARLDARRAALQEARQLRNRGSEALSQIRNYAGIWDRLTIQEQQSAVRSLVERITIRGDQVHIAYKI